MKRFYTLLTMMLCILSANAQHGTYVGGDISDLPLYETANQWNPYLDASGTKIDNLLVWLKNTCGWNTFRVRLFVNPDGTALNEKGESYNDPSVAQDLEYVEKLGKRIKDVGAKFMLDFHYSDCWADPTKQYKPTAWSDYTTSAQIAQKVYDYTVETLTALKNYGAEPDLVQVGNEITGGIAGVWKSSDATGFKAVVEKGCDAVRATCPNAKIIIHIERPQNTDNVVSFYNALTQSKYDIIGLSYYPFWHGYLNLDQAKAQHPSWSSWSNSNLGTTLDRLANSFPSKKVQIVETAYYNNWWPSSGIKFDTRTSESGAALWSASAEGQYNFVCDLIAELAKHSNVDGLIYWFPEEAGCGEKSTVITGWVNRGLWDNNKQSASPWGHEPLNQAKVQFKMKDFLYTTAINEVLSTNKPQVADGKTYNLSGQQVDKSYKGIVIKNGKKVMQ